MTRPVFAFATAVCASLAAPLWAECVNFDTFTKGVSVKQADGSLWAVRRGAHEVMRMDQTNATGVYAKYVIATFGVYPSESSRNGIGTTAEFTYAKTPQEPNIGMDWTSNYKVNDIPHYDKSRQDWHRGKARVTATFLREVTISGCSYRVMGVDVAKTANERTTVVHYAYFPDLRFGTQTRITYDGGGKVEAGIVAMAAVK
jgi:hypothetical protein